MRAHLLGTGLSISKASRSIPSQPRRRLRRTRLESLEQRVVFAADVRSITGTGNNLLHPDWGSTDEELLRVVAAAYSDGVSTPAGEDRLSARAISNLLASQTEENVLSDRNLSAFMYAWGQFVDHDLGLTVAGEVAESLNVAVPAGDAYFDPTGAGGKWIYLTRSEYALGTGSSTDNPREQLNSISAFIDGSQIYGSDAVRAAALRTFSGGRLKTSDCDLLPYNNAGLPNDNASGLPADELYLAGDARANENIELTAIHTLFVREHNRLADRLARQHRTWSDEQIFQQARTLVIGELQAITYNEFLPALLGPRAIDRYRGYDASVNPGIATEFSTAAFRLGHSMLGNDVEFLDNVGNELFDEVALRDAFFNPAFMAETGIDPILKYLASDPAQEIDNQVVDEVRNFLFGPPGAGGFDLASLNIQRGRDHGLADYNSVRVAYGLRAVHSFADISSDPQVQAELAEAYGNVDNIDLWVGGLAEDHARGASVGPLFQAIVADQFERLRDGDRFWYQRSLSGSDLRMVQSTTLADVIRRNTTTTNLQDNVFFFHNTIAGQVFIDADRNGRQDGGETGLVGVTVHLLDLDGNIVASAITSLNGRYTFEDMDLGIYRVQLSLPEGLKPTSRTTVAADLTRAESATGIDFGVVKASRPSRPPRGQLEAQSLALEDINAEPDAALTLGSPV